MSAPAEVEWEVDLFKAFLRIETMHPNPDLKACVAWLLEVGSSLGLMSQVLTMVPGLPIVVLTRQGIDPLLPAIGLNCHMDVVPVVRECWTKLPVDQTPFSAWEDADGNIYARGAQDMKCVGAQYLCALKRLGATPLLRTVHTVWVPDEEIGGKNGMKRFVQSAEFRALNLGVMLDEGLAHEEDKFVVYTGERTAARARFTATGPVGHGSKIIDGTAFEKLSSAVVRLQALRDENVARLQACPGRSLSSVTTVNVTVMQGGTTNDGGATFAPNVIPANAFLIADIRIALEDFSKITQELKKIAADHNLALTFENGFDESIGPSPWSDQNSAYARCVLSSLKTFDVPTETEIFPAATDSRYVRRVGVPAFGFSPMRRTPSLLHDHNEFLNRRTYVEGVNVMTAVVRNLANLPAVSSSHV
jgi:aminoacylase